MNSQDMANAVNQQLGSLRAGSLTFWGNWFGRPYDNLHRIVGAEAHQSTTIIYFDHAESLAIDRPEGWSLDSGQLLVREADRIRFQWFYYGRIPARETLRFLEYRRTGDDIGFTTDFEPAPGVEPSLKAPAVQLHTIK
jgi:hypothetical protein